MSKQQFVSLPSLCVFVEHFSAVCHHFASIFGGFVISFCHHVVCLFGCF